MRPWLLISLRPVLMPVALIGLCASHAQATPLYTITNLGQTDEHPAVPDSLKITQTSNASGFAIQTHLVLPLSRTQPPGSNEIPVFTTSELVTPDGQHVPMGDLIVGANTQPYAINDAGQVVGAAEVTTRGRPNWHAFLYVDGRTLDLNSLILPNPSDLSLTASSAINIDNEGRILAYGQHGDDSTLHPSYELLLTPTSVTDPTTVPEPNTLALLGLASLAAGARGALRRRRAG